MVSEQTLVTEHALDTGLGEHKGLLRNMLMTACDLSAIAKPWEMQSRVAEVRKRYMPTCHEQSHGGTGRVRGVLRAGRPGEDARHHAPAHSGPLQGQ